MLRHRERGELEAIEQIQIPLIVMEDLETRFDSQRIERRISSVARPFELREGRLHILGEMKKALAGPRSDLSPYAPRIVTMQIKPDKIGDVIGPKGKTVRGIQDATGARISIEDSGVITIAGVGKETIEKAREMIAAITTEPEVGKVYEGPVKSTTPFGAFVEILPGVEGLLHISELQHGRTDKTEDVVKAGDVVQVKLLSVDERGRMKLSRKALLPKE